MHTDLTSAVAQDADKWNSFYMNKPTDINAMYPTTESMMAALEDAVIERRVTWIARIITAIIFVVLVTIWYVMYPELAWAVLQYV